MARKRLYGEDIEDILAIDDNDSEDETFIYPTVVHDSGDVPERYEVDPSSGNSDVLGTAASPPTPRATLSASSAFVATPGTFYGAPRKKKVRSNFHRYTGLQFDEESDVL